MNAHVIETEKDQLINLVRKDISPSSISYNRYPVRFILLDSYKDLRDIANSLAEKTEIFELTNLDVFRYNLDAWLSINSIVNIIKNLDPKKNFLIPSISEFARFLSNDELFSLLSSFMEIENTNQYYRRRIYIPVIGMSQRFMSIFWERYHRRFEFIPVWKIPGRKEKYVLYFVNVEIENYPSLFTVIRNSKDFLNLWKNEDLSRKIICLSPILNYYSNKTISDELFDVVRINNPEEYLSEIYKFKVPFSYDWQDGELWKHLIKEVINRRVDNFFGLVEEYLNIKRLEEENVLSLWFRYEDKFSRWLIKNYLICKPEYSNAYTKDVLSSINVFDNTDILKNYYLKIFEEKPNQQRSEERRRVIREFYKEKRELNLSFIDESLSEKIENLDPRDTVKYITGTTPFEKKWIVKNIEFISNLEEMYPELSYYTREINYPNLKPEQLWIEEYFREYRISRLKNKPSERLLDILNEKNANQSTFYKWYYSFYKVEDLLKEDFEKIWIDALSLEFLPLIVNLLTKKGFYVDFNVAVAKLPTSTEFNKVEGIERISELDDFIHSQSAYRYPENLIEEIEMVTRLIDKISSFKDRFLIFSDHGFTSFANKDFQERKLPEIRVAEREARYGALKEDINLVSDEDFMIYQPEKSDRADKYLIALRHKSFSYLSSAETHGGATPEEVIVPVVYASRIPFGEIFYEIKLFSNEITVRSPILKFSVKPKPITSIIVKLSDMELIANYNPNEDIYRLEFPRIKPGTYTLNFVIGNFKTSKDIIIKGGSKEKDLL